MTKRIYNDLGRRASEDDQVENRGFYPPAFFFYQFLLFAVFDAVRLVA